LRKQIDAASDKSAAIGQAFAVLSRMPDKRAALRILSTAIGDSNARHLAAGHMALADMARAAGDHERALEESRRALAAAPRSEEAALRVFEYGLSVDPDRALREATEFVALQPNSRRLRVLLASHLSERGQFDAAMAELTSMAKRSPEDFDLLFMQAQVSYRAKKLEQARGFLDQYVSVQEQRLRASAAAGATDAPAALAEAYQLLSKIAEEQGLLDEAVNLLAKIDDPSMRYNSRIRQALIRAKQKRVDEGLALIDSANAQTDEEIIMGASAGAQILRDANRLSEALALITRALEIAPKDPFILDSMGWVKFRMGQFKEAVDYLQRAYAIRPEAEIAAHLGEALWKLGKQSEARTIWAQGVSQDASNKTLQETLKRFGVKP
jgi:tetratricopeptide (TPR) repeat protein